MKLREKMKRFWTLDVHNHEGFTLVELIIVIAILAILSTGAIAGYSAYVERANKTADQALVAEIKNVLTLYAYANGIGEGGYVVLNSNGDAAEAEGAEVIAALSDAYGENWEAALKLKYTEWTDDGLLEYVLQNADSAELIAGSTFMQDSSADSMMGAVNNLTNAASTVISAWAQNGSNDVASKLTQLGMGNVADRLAGTDLQPGTEAYNIAVSNLLVGHFAGTLNAADPDVVKQDEGFVGLAVMYASLFAYCEAEGKTDVLPDVDAYLASGTTTDDLTSVALMGFLSNNHPDVAQGYTEYLVGPDADADGVPDGGGKGEEDIDALLKIMGAVDLVAGTYDKDEDLSNPNLYTSESVGEQLNNYITAINAVSSIDTSALQNLPDGAVVIFIDADGAVSVMPGAVIPS